MSIFTFSGFVPPAGLTADHPIIGWNNICVAGNMSATFAATDFPPSNLANPATYIKWRSTANTPQVINIGNPSALQFDYLAIVGHNLAGYYCYVDDGATLFSDVVLLQNNSPTIFRFNSHNAASIRFVMDATTVRVPPAFGTAIPEIAVMYLGSLLTVQRRIYANHVPIPWGRSWKSTIGVSETGQFLGRIILQDMKKTKIPLALLDPTWYRANVNPFLAAAKSTPFFFGWRPQSYPDELGYVWLTNEPTPAPTPPSNLISLSLDVTGVN